MNAGMDSAIRDPASDDIRSRLYADTAVYAQWKSGVDSRGWIMGLQTFPLKFAVVGRALIFNISLMLVGFDAKADPVLATDALKKGPQPPLPLSPVLSSALASSSCLSASG
jgi:GPH family glycoside/pentoside/hexuronide:cation symporter